MSEDIRKMINKVKNYKQFVNENNENKTSWKTGEYRFDREKNQYSLEDRVHVRVKDGEKYYHLTTITPEEMKKKKLDFYSDKDIEYFNKTYR
jgi:hypothetical protein